MGASSWSPRNHFSSPRFVGKPQIPSSPLPLHERDSKFQVSASPPSWCSRHSSWAKTFYFEDIFPNLDPTCSSVLHQQTAFHNSRAKKHYICKLDLAKSLKGQIWLFCAFSNVSLKIYLQIRFGWKRTNLTFHHWAFSNVSMKIYMQIRFGQKLKRTPLTFLYCAFSSVS